MANPIEISTRHYFWKPYMAYFAAYELKAYDDANVHLPSGRVLDLGSGDGTFGIMLKELLGFEVSLIGADLNRKSLSKVLQNESVYTAVVNLDARYLPFREDSLDAVFSNALFYRLLPDPVVHIEEVVRVLKPGAEFILTVPTDLADRHYLLSEAFDKFGLNKMGELYRRRINKRMGNVSLLSPENWKILLKKSGLEICKVVPYVTEASSRRWSLLVEIPRLYSGIKLIPIKSIHRLAGSVLRVLFNNSFRRNSKVGESERSDYILIVSRKPSGDLSSKSCSTDSKFQSSSEDLPIIARN